MGWIKRFIDFYSMESRSGSNRFTAEAAGKGLAYKLPDRRPLSLEENKSAFEPAFERRRDSERVYARDSGPSSSPEKTSYDGGRRGNGEKYVYESLNNINMYYPRRFDDIVRLIDSIRMKEAVIVELCYLSEELSQKMLDFMSGAIYALNGGMQRINGTTFLFTPPFVRVNVPQE